MPSPALPSARARGLLLTGLLAGGLALSGCGGSDGSGGSGGSDPSAAARVCRAKWAALGKTYAGRGDADLPSQLPHRWTAYLAGVDYQRTTATARGCGSPLTAQRDEAEALERFEVDLQPYDMTYQLQQVAGPAQAAIAQETGPRRAQRAKALSGALTALTANAPGSYEEQSAGWDQLDDVELTRAATSQAIEDLKVLSSEGYRYQICQTSLATIARVTGGLALGSTGGPATTPSPSS